MTPPTDQTPGKKKRRWIQPLVACLILALVAKFLYKPFRESILAIQNNGFTLGDIRFQWLVVSLLCVMCVRLINGINCKLILGALGKFAPNRKIIPIIWAASLGRYIPGKVLTAGAVVMLVKIGIDWSTALAALGLSVALMALTSLVFALPVLYFPPVNEHFHHPYIATAGGLILFAIILHPRSFVMIANWGLRAIKRPPLPERIHFPSLLKAFGITVLKLMFFAVALYAVGLSVSDIPLKYLVFAMGISALASFSGFVAFPVPAGLGVHEAIYLLMFDQTLHLPIPIVPIILYRLINFLADAILGAIGLMTLDLTPTEQPQTAPATDPA